ncbi:MAG TPA: glycosyltransferase family 2 protein [Thiothrix sp.]|nr:glycosyltransferase family 2 protein [Thiothrix sp.]
MINYRSDVAVIVLTRNAGTLWKTWIDAIKKQTITVGKYLVVDSSSEDDTAQLAKQAGFDLITIPAELFDHGGTRQFAAQLCPDAEYLIYLTQDAILKQRDSLAKMLAVFNKNKKIAQVYGRHIPRPEADFLEKYARQFTYPAESEMRDYRDVQKRGFKAAFSSDVYAAYRAEALRSIGGFPKKILVSEDSYVSARLLQANWKIYYCAESKVEHSHDYSSWQLFQRYFDIGVFHCNEQALFKKIGKPDSEGLRFLISQLYYVVKHRPILLAKAIINIAIKYVAFKIGRYYRLLPSYLWQKISAQKAYWRPQKVDNIPMVIWDNQPLEKLLTPFMSNKRALNSQYIVNKKSLQITQNTNDCVTEKP